MKLGHNYAPDSCTHTGQLVHNIEHLVQYIYSMSNTGISLWCATAHDGWLLVHGWLLRRL